MATPGLEAMPSNNDSTPIKGNKAPITNVSRKSAETTKTIKADEKMQAAMDRFAAELANDSDEESVNTSTHQQHEHIGDEAFNANGSATELSEAEKEIVREELKKTEDEINTLRQVLAARQKHAADLKRKLGISPLTELTADINQSLQHVKETQAYQKTSEVVSGTADTVKNKWNDMRNSSLFKSFESKLGNAYTNVRAKLVASTSRSWLHRRASISYQDIRNHRRVHLAKPIQRRHPPRRTQSHRFFAFTPSFPGTLAF
uniref:Tumor protein D54 n=1 Tax=Ascaris suum TaxID=6253 RepID=F1LCF7_ASCSU